MKTYELTYIISPEMTSEEAEGVSKDIESFIQSKEGVILAKTIPVAKALSYQIKKHASGYIGVIEFQLEPELLSEVKTKLEKDVKVSRHMLIIKKPVRFRKERRSRKPLVSTVEKKETEEVVAKEEPVSTKASSEKEKSKVELKDIEQKLDEILGQ